MVPKLSLFSSSWNIEGDYSYKFDTYIILRQRKEYICMHNKHKIKSITLAGYDTDSHINIYFYDKQNGIKFIDIMSNSYVFIKHNLYDNSIVNFKEANNKIFAHKLLFNLMSFDNSVQYIIADICKTLSINISMGVDIKQLVQMNVSDACEHVIKAQKYDNNLIYELITFYFEELRANKYSIVTPQELYDLMDTVEPKNENYRQVHDIKTNLLMLQDKQQMTQIEQHYMTEQLFVTSLNGTNQSFTDNIFNELCGCSFGEPFIDNVKNDHDTLLLLAAKIKELQKVISDNDS